MSYHLVTRLIADLSTYPLSYCTCPPWRVYHVVYSIAIQFFATLCYEWKVKELCNWITVLISLELCESTWTRLGIGLRTSNLVWLPQLQCRTRPSSSITKVESSLERSWKHAGQAEGPFLFFNLVFGSFFVFLEEVRLTIAIFHHFWWHFSFHFSPPNEQNPRQMSRKMKRKMKQKWTKNGYRELP